MAERWELVEPIEGEDDAAAEDDDALWPSLDDFRSSIREAITKHVDDSAESHGTI